jgi:hypothetical protein
MTDCELVVMKPNGQEGQTTPIKLHEVPLRGEILKVGGHTYIVDRRLWVLLDFSVPPMVCRIFLIDAGY